MKQTISESPGLWTSPNPEETPAGSLKQAINVVVRRPGIIEPFKSVSTFGTSAGSLGGNVRLWPFNNRVHIFSNLHDPQYDSDGFGTWANLGSVASVINSNFNPFDAAENSGALYVSDANGLTKIDALGGTPQLAGAPPGIDVTLSASGSTGFLVNNASVGYRVTWLYKDANSHLVEGAPSMRATYHNAAGNAVNVTVKAYIPQVLVVASTWVYRVYRTKTMADAVAGTASDPGDDEFLCYEVYVTSTDVSNGYVSFTDVAADNYLGLPCYTNAAGDGPFQANEMPPLSDPVAQWKQTTWLGNTQDFARRRITMIGTPTVMAISSIANVSGNTWRYTMSTTVTATVGDYLGTVSCTTSGNNGTFVITNVGSNYIDVTNASGASQVGAAGSAVTETVTISGTHLRATLQAESTSNGYFNVSNTGIASTDLALTTQSLCRVYNIFVTGSGNQQVWCLYDGNPNAPPGQFFTHGRAVVSPSSYTISSSPATTNGLFVPNLATAAASNNDTAVNRVRFSKWTTTAGGVSLPDAFPSVNALDIGGGTKKVLRIIPTRSALFVFKEDGLFLITGDPPFTPGNPPSVTLLDPTVLLVGPQGVVALGDTVYAICTRGIAKITTAGADFTISRPIYNSLQLWYVPANGLNAKAWASDSDQIVYFNTANAGVLQYLAYSVATGAWTSGTSSSLGNPATYLGGVIYSYLSPNIQREVDWGLGAWPTTVEWNKHTGGDDAAFKQYREVQIDLDPSSTIDGSTNATITIYSEIDGTGGTSATLPAALKELRMLVPLTVQRCRELSLKFTCTTTATKTFAIKGVAYTWRPYVVAEKTSD